MTYTIPEARVYIKEMPYEFEPKKIVNTPLKAKDFIYDILHPLDRECLICVTFDAKLRPINYHIVSIGSIDASMLNVASIIKIALLSNAPNIMMFHNHPSGVAEPSQEDIRATVMVRDACKLMGMKLIDHCIIGDNTYY